MQVLLGQELPVEPGVLGASKLVLAAAAAAL